MSLVTYARTKLLRGRLPVDYQAWINGTATPEQAERCIHDLVYKFHVMNGTDGSEIMEGERRVVLYILKQARVSIERLQTLADREIVENE